MRDLIVLLDGDKIKGKRVKDLAELVYNNNGRVVTSNLNHINAAYKLAEMIEMSIKRVDYSTDYIIEVF